ncbi:MAG: SpoIID/LytB domain-containing protein [Candidatus Omnitrophica bacterium]|nr:SpoIID/LytB domain-containing protein [Candidatus Omnitrophota bacterium]
MKRVFFYLLLVPWFLSPAFAQEEPIVRVAVLQEQERFRLTVTGPWVLTDSRGARLGWWPHLKWKEVELGPEGIRLGRIQTRSFSVRVKPLGKAQMKLNAKPFRGELAIYRTQKGKMTVVNFLELERYLVGALASEASAAWPEEALKAHAIVSRTAVAHRMWVNRARPFDVTADAQTHLYKGMAAERQGSLRAVEATRGQVLAYNRELLSAAFHSNCGGHTENAAELWGATATVPPLSGFPDPYCRGLKHSQWKTELTAEELTRLLGDLSTVTGPVRSCEVLDRNGSGRVRAVRLTGAKGSVEVSGKRLRELMGANRLKSLNFTVGSSGHRLFFSGSGWGHGVGFCQWGAFGMATQGKQMDEILSFYFPETQRRKLQGLPGFSAKNR